LDFSKVAGFVDESLWFETNWTFLDFCSRIESTNQIFWKVHHESNPRIESFERSRSNQIHETNLLNTTQTHGFARRIHGYTIPLYNSRNLNFFPCGHWLKKSWKTIQKCQISRRMKFVLSSNLNNHFDQLYFL
jgi:hypothetical protein